MRRELVRCVPLEPQFCLYLIPTYHLPLQQTTGQACLIAQLSSIRARLIIDLMPHRHVALHRSALFGDSHPLCSRRNACYRQTIIRPQRKMPEKYHAIADVREDVLPALCQVEAQSAVRDVGSASLPAGTEAPNGGSIHLRGT